MAEIAPRAKAQWHNGYDAAGLGLHTLSRLARKKALDARQKLPATNDSFSDAPLRVRLPSVR
jgi:hypothetical protein